MDDSNIIKLVNVTSTNEYLLSLKQNNFFKEGLIVVSDYQSKGIGQRGKIWHSKRNKNLMISMLIEPNIPFEKRFDVNKITAISIIDLLNSIGLSAKIKWPNDILVKEKKIAGVLIHNVVSAQVVKYSIIGLGLNVNQLSFPYFLPQATSLKIELNQNFILDDIQKKWVKCFKNRMKAYRSGKTIDFEYLSSLFKLNETGFFAIGSQKTRGSIKGVTDTGLLKVKIEKEIKMFDLQQIKMIF